MIRKMASLLLGLTILVSTNIITTQDAVSDSSKAFISRVNNKVQVRKNRSRGWRIASKNIRLSAGDTIRTGRRSKAEIIYNDGTRTRIGSNSLLKVRRNKKKERTRIRLLLGKLWLKVTKGSNRVKIETPSAIASVLGTELIVSNNTDNVSHVTTLEGLVSVQGNQGDETLVKGGEWVEINPGEKMEKPSKFAWDELKTLERFVLEPDFMPSEDESEFEDETWK